MIKQDKKAEDKRKIDARNLDCKKIGLTNYEDFVHSNVSEQQIAQREQLLKHKEMALNKSPNLFVSKLRLALRNLPLHKFYEQELRELLNVVVDEWLKSLSTIEAREAKK